MENVQYPNNLRRYREAAGLSQPELAKRANTSPQNISRLERGDRQLTKRWAEQLAPVLKVAPQWIMFHEAGDNVGTFVDNAHALADARKGANIPAGRVLYGGAVRAGEWLSVDDFNQDVGNDSAPEWIPMHPGYPQLLQSAWEVRGDSMDLAGIHDGMWAVAASYGDYVDKVGELDNGNYVIVERSRLGGSERERTVKEVQFARKGMRLVPRSSNPAHREFFIDLDPGADNDTEQVSIIGVVLWAVRDMDPRSRK